MLPIMFVRNLAVHQGNSTRPRGGPGWDVSSYYDVLSFRMLLLPLYLLFLPMHFFKNWRVVWYVKYLPQSQWMGWLNDTSSSVGGLQVHDSSQSTILNIPQWSITIVLGMRGIPSPKLQGRNVGRGRPETGKGRAHKGDISWGVARCCWGFGDMLFPCETHISSATSLSSAVFLRFDESLCNAKLRFQKEELNLHRL